MATNPFDQYDAPAKNPFDEFDDTPPKAGALRQISDVGVAGLQGVVGGAKSIADFAGANNKVSSLLSTANDGLQSVLSEPRRAEIAARQRAVEAADASGSTIDSITSRLGGFAEAPVSTIAQGLGSTLPTIAAVALPSTRSAMARQVIGAGVGAAQGAGSVKGGIYDSVKQAKIDAGATPAEADAAAEDAQRFDGANAAQVALGGALGAVAASSGAERLVDGLVHGVTKTPKNLLPRVAAGAAAEALPEGAQGAQQQLAQNLALTNSGTPTDPMKGVIGAGVLDAAVSAPIGAGFAAPRPRDATATQPAPEAPPAVDPVSGASALPVEPVLDTQAPAPAAATAPGDPLRATKIPEAGPLSRGINTLIEGEAQAADAGAPVQTPVTGALAGVPAEDAAPKIPVGEATEVDPIPAGEATELSADQVQPAAGPTFDPSTGEISQPQRATFPTREAVDEYLRQARLQQGGERAKAAPVELPDGTFSFLRPNEPGYDEALTESKQTVLQRKRAAAAKVKAEAAQASPPSVLQQRRAAAAATREATAAGAQADAAAPPVAPAEKPVSVLQQRRAAAAATRERADAAPVAPAVKAPNVLQQRRTAAAAAKAATAPEPVAPVTKPPTVLQQRRAAALAAKQNAGAPAADTGALGSAPSVATPPTAPAPTADDTNQPRRVRTQAQAPADQAQPPARGDGAARVAEPAVAGPAAVQTAGVAPSASAKAPAKKKPSASRETSSAKAAAESFDIGDKTTKAHTAGYEPATQAHRDVAAELQRRLQSTFPGVVLDAVAPRADTGGAGGSGRGERGVPGERAASVAEVAKRLFKREVVFVKFDGPSRFNGAVSDAFPGKIFLSVDSEKPLMAVLGHELVHSMRGGNPVVYEALKRRLNGLLKNEQQYIDKLDAKYAARGVSPAKVRHGEELHGDIVGDFFMDPVFWQDMAKDKPGLFRRVANAVIKFLDNAAKRITNLKPFGSEEYLADIAAARRAVATTLREFSEATAPEASLPGSEENFSLADSLTAGINNVKDVKLPAGYLVQDLFNRTGKLHWWHKTVGTMNNLAQRSPEFKRVYDATQNFINDVSAYGTAAADLAPSILPKLEGWKDILAKPLSPADTKAISAPIFEGTLTWARDGKGRPVKLASLEDAASGMSAQDKAQAMLRDGKVGSDELKRWQNLPIDSYEGAIRNRYEREYLTAGVVWKDAELRSMFGLNDKQIGLYKEFRAATDKSLTNLAISDMLRYGGDDVAAVRQAALDAPNIDVAAELLRDHLFAQAKADPDRADVLNSTGNGMIDKADKAKSLMQRGYAPLSRFGQYTVYVTEGDEQRYFGMFESAAEANRMARRMKVEFPDATIQQGTVSQEAYKMFAGVSPETLELFGGMLGLETQGNDASSQAFQTYLKLAKSNRSAMKRLIQRKGIAGFSEDAGRVLAGFVYSNARQTSSNLHMGEMTQAASDVSKGEGELKDQAVRLVDYVKNPQEEAQALRGLLFAQYLGGSVASAIVNVTQPFAVTLPYLSQYGGAVKAGKQMSRALADVYKKATGDAALDAALKKAENDGIVSPQEVHQLMQQAQGSGSLKSGDGTITGFAAAKASNAMSKFSLGWGKLFSTAEQFNRRITFIAAYRTAVDQGMADPAAFAADVVNQTQFTYNKGNKPAWARGAIGGTLFTFKQYSISYVELMSRLWRSGPEGKKAAALGIGMLMLMSGADELPFTEDVDDVIDGFMQRYMGYNFSTKQQREQFLTNLLGEGGGRFVLKGVSGLAGVPVDLSGRLGMGNLLPGTGLIPKKTDYSRDLGEFAGPAGDFAKRIFQGAGKVLGGDVGEGVLSVTPVAARNFWKAKDMWTTGMYRDDKGRKVIDTTAYEAVAKAIGFQPNDVARVQDATGQKQQMIALNKIRETEIADDWAQGVFEKDDGKIADARAALRDWNQKNPESPIRINPSQVMKRVRSMREDKATRIAKTAPKEIRASVRADLAEAR